MGRFARGEVEISTLLHENRELLVACQSLVAALRRVDATREFAGIRLQDGSP